MLDERQSRRRAFHDAEIDTDILADILARIVARMSACRSACHRNNFIQEIARVGRVGEDPREDVGVGVVECGLYAPRRRARCTQLQLVPPCQQHQR